MPDVVLRHPDVPQPLVVSVAPGQYVDPFLQAAGWVIDTGTDPEAAEVEAQDVVDAALQAAAEAAETFVPAFPPDPAPDAASPAASPVLPAEPAPVDADPAPADTTSKEN